jgi:4-hydroxy-tetrahydrodipicolinate synthase
MFEGSMTALITPFRKDGSVDDEGLRELVDFQIENGIDGIVAVATTGESATLSVEEHVKTIGIVIDQANGRRKVVAGAGANCTAEAIELTRASKDLGADGVLSVCPYYNKPTQRGIYEHFKKIAEIDIPLILYNVPSRTSRAIEAGTILRLAELPNVVGVKEASGDLAQIMNILERCPTDFSVLSGDDSFTYTIMCLGGKGVVSVASNVAPKEVSEMVHCLLDGRYEEAKEMHFRLLPLFRDLFIETNPIPVKEALRMMRKPSGAFRLPLCDMEEGHRAILAETLRRLGLI